MNRQELLERKKEVHSIFKKRILLHNNSAKMEEDLQRFNKGVSLLLNGRTYRECCDILDGFSTVYGWIKRGIMPLSFMPISMAVEFVPPPYETASIICPLQLDFQSLPSRRGKPRILLAVAVSSLAVELIQLPEYEDRPPVWEILES